MGKIISFIIGIIIGAGLVGGAGYILFVGPGIDRDRLYREQQQQLTDTSTELGRQLTEERATIEEAKRIIISTGDSIQKLRKLVTLLRDSGSNNPYSLSH